MHALVWYVVCMLMDLVYCLLGLCLSGLLFGGLRIVVPCLIFLSLLVFPYDLFVFVSRAVSLQS